jgi:adenine deaminase
MTDFSYSGMIVDIINRKIFPGAIHISNGRISGITQDQHPKNPFYILPGFIDAHVHIESSMLIPSEFARLASVHGTVATISDPHEIGNVLGIDGIRYMIQNGNRVPFHFYFGASSCIPATKFETAGGVISANDIETLFREDNLKYLSEMMNYPGVLAQDLEIMKKINVARSFGKPIDGHAPGLRGLQAKQYIASGISTDHECVSLDEAIEKINFGMHILIREGSAAKNYETLHPLIKMFPKNVMFCCDDKHPHELVEGHINELVKRSIVKKGYDLMDVLRAASLNPITHYNLNVGLLRQNDSADFIIVNNLQDFDIIHTYVKGVMIAKQGKTCMAPVEASTPNHFATSFKKPKDFVIPATKKKIHVIQAEVGQITTQRLIVPSKISQNTVVPDIERDILKLTVVNRYHEAKPAVAFVQNFGLKCGALASCISHDSHNIIAVGCSDEEICKAVNLLIENKGGIAVVNGKSHHVLPLPVAGIMTNEDGYIVAKKYLEIDKLAKDLGTPLHAPFMTLSFMALLVIPKLKLSDKGLFDNEIFDFISLQT